MGKWMGFKLMLFLGNLIIAASIFVASFMTNFWTFIIFYGFTFGMANGALYVVPMKIGFLYYPHRKGMVSGTIVAGFGMGSFIWSYVALYLINP